MSAVRLAICCNELLAVLHRLSGSGDSGYAVERVACARTYRLHVLVRVAAPDAKPPHSSLHRWGQSAWVKHWLSSVQPLTSQWYGLCSRLTPAGTCRVVVVMDKDGIKRLETPDNGASLDCRAADVSQ